MSPDNSRRSAPVTLNELLLELHDHLGQDVEASVALDFGSHSTSVLNVNGLLQHWSVDKLEIAGRLDADGEQQGFYLVGVNGSIDVTVAADARRLLGPGGSVYGVAYDLAEGVEMTVTWGLDGRDSEVLERPPGLEPAE